MIMTGNIALSLILTATVIGVAFAFQIFRPKSRHVSQAAVPAVDLLAKSFIDLDGRSDAALEIAIAWALLATVLGVGVPFAYGNKAFIMEPNQIIISVQFSLVVPMLLGSYIYLVKSLGYFAGRQALRRRTPMRRRAGVDRSGRELSGQALLFQAVLFVVVLVVQYLAIQSEIEQPYSMSPWSNGAVLTHATDLTIAGAFYYCLRGLNTYMALGLICVIVAFWYRLRARLEGESLVDFSFPKLGPTKAIQNVGAGLLLAVFFGSLVAAINGLSLAVSAYQLTSPQAKIGLFINSTWAGWLILTILTTAVVVATVIKLHAKLVAELRGLQTKVEAQYLTAHPSRGVSVSNLANAKLRADITHTNLSIRMKIAEIFEKAKTWPLPVGWIPAFGLSLAVQVINIMAPQVINIMAEVFKK